MAWVLGTTVCVLTGVWVPGWLDFKFLALAGLAPCQAHAQSTLVVGQLGQCPAGLWQLEKEGAECRQRRCSSGRPS